MFIVCQVSNLFNRDEKGDIIAEMIPTMKREQPRRPPTPENVLDYFFYKTRKNLHVVLCFSPVSLKHEIIPCFKDYLTLESTFI